MATIETTVFTIKINKLIAYPEKNNYTNMVFVIVWNITGTFTDPTTLTEYSSSNDILTNVDTDNIQNFIPYDQLTEPEVLNWINLSENMDQIKFNLVNNINSQINPPPQTLVILDPPF
jgi:hypothetical protein